MPKTPEVKYTSVGDAAVAYQVVGKSPIDLTIIPSFGSATLDMRWEFPPIARFLEGLASFSRLILFDRRGQGLSDPIVFESTPSWEHLTEDVDVVLDAAGSDRTALFAELDGGFTGLLYAASHPERVSALVLWTTVAKNPYNIPREQLESFLRLQAHTYGTEDQARISMPSMAHDEEAMAWIAKSMRAAQSPQRALRSWLSQLDVDVSPVLSSIRVPTLLLHRAQNPFMPSFAGREVADGIPDAQFIEIPGRDMLWWGEGSDEILAQIQEFLTGAKGVADRDRFLATVLFTDIVDSTQLAASLGDRRWNQLLSKHDHVTQQVVSRAGGRLVKTTGDGVLATFDGPARAIRCAFTMGDRLREEGMDIRAGLHTGEVELRGEDVGGIGVHIAARVMAAGGAGEVVCSRTVKDLVAGSEFTFEDRGLRALKGVPDEWQLYAVKAN